MSNETCIFYPFELIERPRDKFIYKKFEKSKLYPMAATKEYLKCKAESNVVHTNFFYLCNSLWPTSQRHNN